MSATGLMLWAALSLAQTPAPAAEPPSRFGIEDNSFLVEEAINQERGIFQNILVFTRSRDGAWTGSFTQEWPVGGQRHQLSATIPFSRIDGAGGVGDVLVNYRLQVWDGSDARPAFSPRLSVVLPSSADRRDFGTGGVGWQANLPFSKRAGRVYWHANAGNTWLRESGRASDWQSTPFVAGSAIVAVRPMFNLMLELYQEWQPTATGRDRVTTVAPGMRGGWNVGDTQWIIGVAAPITRGARRDHAVLGYLSYELPFTKNR